MSIEKLSQLCKSHFTLKVNPHKSSYESVKYYLDESWQDPMIPENGEMTQDVYNKMIETDTMIEFQVYPFTPVSFFTVFHYDLNEAIKEAIKEIERF